MDFFNCVIENDFIPIIGHVNRILLAAMNAFRPAPPPLSRRPIIPVFHPYYSL